MNRFLTILTVLSALLGAAPFIRPRSPAGEALLWVPKLLGGALSPAGGLFCSLAALIGLARRDWVMAGVGLLGAGLAARLVTDLPDVDRALAGLPGASRDVAWDRHCEERCLRRSNLRWGHARLLRCARDDAEGRGSASLHPANRGQTPLAMTACLLSAKRAYVSLRRTS